MLKLNLGCGTQKKEGFLNVDLYEEPDLKWDLEEFPWPWEDNAADEAVMHHVLEHLGQSPQTFLKIMQELYRVCANGAKITIVVPHPRHDDFLSDPTHVRPITPFTMRLFSKKFNSASSASRLAFALDVDFELVNINYQLAPAWQAKFDQRLITEDQLKAAINDLNNVVTEIQMVLTVVK